MYLRKAHSCDINTPSGEAYFNSKSSLLSKSVITVAVPKERAIEVKTFSSQKRR